MNIRQELTHALVSALARCNLATDPASIRLEYPENPEHGDYSANVALAYAKKMAMSPRALAENIVAELEKEDLGCVEKITIAGPGFINFTIKDSVFAEKVVEVAMSDGEYGWSTEGAGTQIMVEYTDPNPFKVFHIGHLMSNAVGESISRLMQTSGAEVVRACYQGDVGLHVGKTIWGMINLIKAQEEKPDQEKSITEKVAFLGEAYVLGSNSYDDNAVAKDQITIINKAIYDGANPTNFPDIQEYYTWGRKVSLQYFDTIYARLGTSFNTFFFESEVADTGVAIVKEFLKKGVFVESEGAVIFKGDDHGVHTRVFITSNGLPTYETKELGLNTKKFEMYPKLDQSVIITANEQSDYFKVLLKVFSLVNPRIAEKTKHISHGILRFASGKMSSRKGNIISAESLIDDIKALAQDKIAGREFAPEETDRVSDEIAIGAIKYTILRQAIGGDVIFDSATSVSFEGDSGPYLQYSAVRAGAVLERAKAEGIQQRSDLRGQAPASTPEKLIERFPDIVARARTEYAPQHVANYLITLAGAFNGFYASGVIVNKDDPASPYRVAVTKAFLTTMTNGLWILGIKVPKKM
jgi:arginyl-tRNA synthetase